MNEFDSPSYTEYAYEKKPEGALRTFRFLLVLLYIAFVGLLFLFCYLSKLIPLFALAPVFTWMLVFFTWRYVSYDIYYTFNHGEMEFGTYKTTKGGARRRPRFTVDVRLAEAVVPYSNATDTVALRTCDKVYEYCSSISDENLILMIFNKDGKRTAVIFNGTKRVASLLSTFAPNAKGLKDKDFV
ncbi:MAG: hypothetical protein IKA64_03405 [Clostridia bacterium]|nr:hypothetical protein [Clostridia bacterium]